MKEPAGFGDGDIVSKGREAEAAALYALHLCSDYEIRLLLETPIHKGLICEDVGT